MTALTRAWARVRPDLLAALPAGMLDRVRLRPDAELWVDLVEPAGDA